MDDACEAGSTDYPDYEKAAVDCRTNNGWLTPDLECEVNCEPWCEYHEWRWLRLHGQSKTGKEDRQMRHSTPLLPSTAESRARLRRMANNGLPALQGAVASLLADFDLAVQHVRALREVLHGDACQTESTCLPVCSAATDWLLERDNRESRGRIRVQKDQG